MPPEGVGGREIMPPEGVIIIIIIMFISYIAQSNMR